MLIRELDIEDRCQLFGLINNIEANLINKVFWLPINSVSKGHFFDKDWTIFYGAFEDEELIGACGLFLNLHEYGESLSKLDDNSLLESEVAELGRAMINPTYRGNNILLDITMKLVEKARELDKKYLIATIHPDNIPSKKSFEKLGMEYKCRYTKSGGYIRDIYGYTI